MQHGGGRASNDRRGEARPEGRLRAAPAPPRRRTAPRALVVVLVLAIVATLGAGIWAIVSDDDTPDAALPSTGLDPDEFRLAFNDAAEALGSTLRLPAPTWEADDAIGLEISTHAIGGWAILELYRGPDEQIASIVLLAQPTDDDERAEFEATAGALLAAAVGEPAEEGARLLREELAVDADAGSAGEAEHQRDGLRLRLESTGDASQLTVTATDETTAS